MPAEANLVIKWFEENYVHGTARPHSRRRTPPLFSPDVWSVFENNIIGFPRTQNNVESWHRRWHTLVGRAHVGLFTMINEIKKEQSNVEAQIERNLRGEPLPAKSRVVQIRERALQNILANRDGYENSMEFLKAIAHRLVLGV